MKSTTLDGNHQNNLSNNCVELWKKEENEENYKKERVERERQEREKQERQRIEIEKLLREKERMETIKLERERQERQEKLERLKLEREREERERIQREKLEREKQERKRMERIKLEREREERERLEREKIIKFNVLEKENSILKYEIRNLKIKITTLEGENNKLSTKRINFLQDFSLLVEDLKNKFKLLNEKMKYELDEINLLQNEYRMIKDNKSDVFFLNEDLFIGTNKEKEDAAIFNCPICLNTVLQPETCSECETIFCSNCINHHIKTFNDCPNCKIKPLPRGKLNRMLKNLLDTRQFLCPLECGSNIEYANLEKHKQICMNNNNFKCSLCKETIIEDNNFKEKHINECEKLKINCFYCQKTINKFEYKNHLDTCNEAFYYCQECSMKIPIKFATIHSDHFCEEVKS